MVDFGCFCMLVQWWRSHLKVAVEFRQAKPRKSWAEKLWMRGVATMQIQSHCCFIVEGRCGMVRLRTTLSTKTCLTTFLFHFTLDGWAATTGTLYCIQVFKSQICFLQNATLTSNFHWCRINLSPKMGVFTLFPPPHSLF